MKERISYSHQFHHSRILFRTVACFSERLFVLVLHMVVGGLGAAVLIALKIPRRQTLVHVQMRIPVAPQRWARKKTFQTHSTTWKKTKEKKTHQHMSHRHQPHHAPTPESGRSTSAVPYRECVLFLRRPNAIWILGLVALRPLAAVFDALLRGDGCTTNIFPSSRFLPRLPGAVLAESVKVADVFPRTWGGDEARGLLWRR